MNNLPAYLGVVIGQCMSSYYLYNNEPLYAISYQIFSLTFMILYTRK
jgi:hypothetical protein